MSKAAPNATPSRRPLTRLAPCLWALALSGAFAAVIVSTLAARVPNILDTPIEATERGGEPRPVPLIETGGPQPPVYISWLRTDDPRLVVEHPEIRILFATYGAHVRLRHASLEVLGTSCVYEPRADARLENNGTVAFVRGPTCNPLRPGATGELRLTVGIGRRTPIAVWTFDRLPARSGATSHAVEVEGLPGRSGPFPVLRGTYVDYLPGTGTRRIELLNYLWTTDSSVRWIWVMVAASCALLFAGLCLTATSGPPGRAIGASALAGAAALLWVVVMPPLQGADEPDHLLSFAQLVHIDIEPELRVLAQRTHFDRIAFREHERFRPVDRDHPDPIAWNSNDIFAQDIARRSPVTALLWRAAARVFDLRHARPFQTLFRLRLLHAITFALAVGLSTLFVQHLLGGAGRPWSLIGMGIVPTIPYFATMVSDWAVFASLSVVWSAALLVVWDDGAAALAGGLLLGGSFGLLAATGIAALPLVPLFAAVLAGRMVCGAGTEGYRVRRAVTFWGGVASGLAVGLLLVARVYRAGYSRGDSESGAGLALMTTVNGFLGMIAARPWLLLAPLAFGALAEISLQRIRWSSTTRLVTRRGLAGLVVLTATAAVAILISSAFITWPTLGFLEDHTFTSPSQYVRAVLAALATSVRLDSFDQLAYTSFWSGFGWLDVILPDAWLAAFAASSVLVFALLSIRLAARSETGRLGRLVLVLAGAVASAGAYAVAGYYLNRNVHGRYLMALYLPLIVVAWQGAALPLDDVRVNWWKRFVGPGIISALVAAHASGFVRVLQRFF